MAHHGLDIRCASHVSDECDEQNGGCDQLCRNVPGARRCDCRKGFQLLQDKTRSFLAEIFFGVFNPFFIAEFTLPYLKLKSMNI
jgi:hypothetical protein